MKKQYLNQQMQCTAPICLQSLQSNDFIRYATTPSSGGQVGMSKVCEKNASKETKIIPCQRRVVTFHFM